MPEYRRGLPFGTRLCEYALSVLVTGGFMVIWVISWLLRGECGVIDGRKQS